MRLALAVTMFLIALTARAQPNPTTEVVKEATTRTQWLGTLKFLTNDERVVNLALFYGREFELRPDPADRNSLNVYLVTRSKPGGPITFMWLIGKYPSEFI